MCEMLIDLFITGSVNWQCRLVWTFSECSIR